MSKSQLRVVVGVVAALLVAITAAAIGQSIDSDASDVRISARRLDDGKTEFALQQRVNGEWNERILPRSRFFPADPGNNRWLNSSPISIETGLSSETGGDEKGPIEREEGQVHYDDGRFFTSVRVNVDDTGASWLNSTLWVKADTYAHEPVGSAVWLAIGCRAGHRIAEVHQVDLEPARDAGYFYNADYAVYPASADGVTTVRNLRWDVDDSSAPWGIRIVDIRLDTRFYLHIRHAENLGIRLVGNGTTEYLPFSLDGFWDTPVQPNLDHCGDYY